MKTGLSSGTAGLSPHPMRTFFDSNVLLYADDAKYPEKLKRAVALIQEHRRRRTGVISLQILQEYFVNARRKLNLDAETARYKVEFFAQFQLVEPKFDDILAAIDIHRLHGVSYWDALVLYCARRSGCTVLLTEDLQHGQKIEGIRIVNPFL
jgi:predicted nucleic acid-binding protein